MLFLSDAAKTVHPFARTLLPLVVHPAPFRSARRTCGAAQLGRRCRFADQCGQTFARVFAIARLAAEALRGDHQDAGGGQALAGQLDEALAHRCRQALGLRNVKAQFNRGGDLVDVLATGA